MYYGQFLTDKIIEEYFDNDYIGGCIDIGATNGVFINNTLHFEEKGWYCLCIEPNPNSFIKLKENRKNTLNYAISNHNRDFVDFTIVNLNDGSLESEGAISSLSLDKNLYQKHLDMGFNITINNIKVSVRTLDYCIENFYKYSNIDFLDIDTEGTELDVIKGFDINRWQPKLIVIENNYNDTYIESYLKEYGYFKDKRIDVNDYFIKRQKKKFLLGPKLGDLIHSLYVVKSLSNNMKSDIYVVENNGAFSNGLEYTYNDIYSFVKKQPYIDNFLIYNENIKDIIPANFDNTDSLFKKTWYEIFQKLFNIKDEFQNEQWLYPLSINEYNVYSDKIVIHFSVNRYSNNYDNLIENILCNNECIFITSDTNEYENFKFKHLIRLKKCDMFFEFCSIIENCKFFIGNQSMPLAVAHGLFKPHLGFLHGLDAIHYKDNFNDNYFWFDNLNYISANFKNINNFIKMDIEFSPIVRDLSNVNFSITTHKDINQVWIICNSNLVVSVIAYEYNILTKEKKIIYAGMIEFNEFENNWFSFSKKLEDMKYINLYFSHDNIMLTEQIIEII